MSNFAPTPALDRWRALALTFPVVRECAPPEALTDPAALDAWAAGEGSSGARHTAAFLCGAWNSRHPRKVGAFDLFEALRVWDSKQIGAFRAWTEAGCRRF